MDQGPVFNTQQPCPCTSWLQQAVEALLLVSAPHSHWSSAQVTKKLWTGRDGQKRTEKATTVHSAVQYSFWSCNEKSYFSSVAGTWQPFSEFLKKKQNCSTICETHLSFPFPHTYAHYITLPVEYSNICMLRFPAEMHRHSFTITRIKSAVQQNCSVPIT